MRLVAVSNRREVRPLEVKNVVRFLVIQVVFFVKSGPICGEFCALSVQFLIRIKFGT